MGCQVRFVRTDELAQLPELEAAGDAQFDTWFGEPTGWGAPSTGEWRARQPGFVLVAVEDGVLAGFAHVLERDGVCHLDQLVVEPGHQRRGLGTALVQRVRAEAAGRGHAQVSLCTFADVPWNAPFYARLGFAEVRPTHPVHRRLREKERSLGLDRLGRRVLMTVGTGL